MGMPAMYISTFMIKYNQSDIKEWELIIQEMVPRSKVKL
jgi:hypothetical protein